MLETKPEWPVLKSYDQDHLAEIALPIGGIGTGTISLGGRGNLLDFQLTNKPRKGFVPRETFFALRCQKGDEAPVLRMLESEVQPPWEHYRGFDQGGYVFYGLPRFRNGSFHAAYPFGQVLLSSPEVPLRVRIEAFNPMVPGNSEASGIPIAVLRFVLHNPTDEEVHASVLGVLGNFIGDEYWRGVPVQRRVPKTNLVREGVGEGGQGFQGLFVQSAGTASHHSSAGTVAMVIAGAKQVSVHRSWAGVGQGRPVSVERLWRHFERYGNVRIAEENNPEPVGALSASLPVAPGEEKCVTYLISWHFPNHIGWHPEESDKQREPVESPVARNWYATQYSDAWDVLEKVAGRLPELEAKTTQFVQAFTQSDAPEVIKEAALFNASTLRSTTCFRMEDGNFFGFEGSYPANGMCPGSCTHVWAYETTTPYLFGDLSRSMRDVLYRLATDEEGRQSFRVTLPLSMARRNQAVAADGQMSAFLKLHQDWKLSGDTDWLRGLWPNVRAAMAFAWIKNGWDGDEDGVMEGVQHNTSDLELFGPNPLMATWYLAALRATEEMAQAVGDEQFAQKCRSLFTRGSKWIDANLYNGEYYIQIPKRPPPFEEVPKSSWLTLRDLPENEPLPQQIDNGCQTDQLVGQLWAHVCGLGYVLEPEHVRQTLRSVYQRNFREMRYHAAFFRAFALNGERGLVFGTYPEDDIPEIPNFRFSEVWNGCEYAAAAHMIYEGQTDAALEVIGAIRDRYDGRKRNPFNESECGSHYARSMAAWTCYLAWTGFRYDGTKGEIQFRAIDQPSRFFWSNGYAWGTVDLQPETSGTRVALRVLKGELPLQSVVLPGLSRWAGDHQRVLQADDVLECRVSRSDF
jgi:uncharacterized protein (DUF608 family)